MTSCGFDICTLPEELFLHVLVFVPARDVVKQCSLVCKHWLSVCRGQCLWRQKCENERRFLPGLMGPPPQNFMVFYFQNPYRKNLLRNTHASGLQFWIKPGGYLYASVETFPFGADPISDHVPGVQIQGRKVQNWVTSHQFTVLTQQVRLLDVGCSEIVLDKVRPPIQASAWCAARWDCGARFQLAVKLLNSNKQEVDSMGKEMDLEDTSLRRMWHKVELTFTDYAPGVRCVEFRMGGSDTQFWAGNYGAKFTLPSLRFVFKKQ